MSFPGWEPFDGPDSDDLDAFSRAQIEAIARAVPETVSTATVHYGDERRFGVPVTLVCPEFSPTQAQEWLDDGQIPELAKAARLALVDIDSGHWPMVTRPAELALLLGAIDHR